MTDCIPNAENACVNCGWQWKRETPFPRRNCPRSPDLQPAVEKLGVTLADVAHYAQAVAKWTAAGFPTRPQEEVERIERDLCRPCEQYREGRCGKCGCCVNASSIPLTNKIKMGSESCPLSKW